MKIFSSSNLLSSFIKKIVLSSLNVDEGPVKKIEDEEGAGKDKSGSSKIGDSSSQIDRNKNVKLTYRSKLKSVEASSSSK